MMGAEHFISFLHSMRAETTAARSSDSFDDPYGEPTDDPGPGQVPERAG